MDETNESTTAAAANGVSNTGTTTAWFEFILDETLLERHLSDTNAGERLLELHPLRPLVSSVFGKSSESVQCAITGPCLRSASQAFITAHCTDSEDLPGRKICLVFGHFGLF